MRKDVKRIRQIRKRLSQLKFEMWLDEEPPLSLQAELARQDRIQRRAREKEALLAELHALRESIRRGSR